MPMTAGELRKALENIPDDMAVVIPTGIEDAEFINLEVAQTHRIHLTPSSYVVYEKCTDLQAGKSECGHKEEMRGPIRDVLLLEW